MSLSYADVREMLETLERVRDYEFVEITMGDFTLRAAKTSAAVRNLQLSGAQLPGEAAVHTNGESHEKSKVATMDNVEPGSTDSSSEYAIPEGMIAVRSPMAGIFYLTPGPNEPEFVAEGGDVVLDDTVCLVEVMKLFNSVKAPVAGSVHKILAVHSEPVEHDQILMVIEPKKAGGPE